MSRPAIHLHARVLTPSSLRLAPDGERTTSGLAPATILVVDDDLRVRRLTARMLRQVGYLTLEAGSGEDALDLLDRHPEIRAVVSDIVMPVLNGVELGQRIVARYPACRVVLVTGFAPHLLGQFGITRLHFPVLVKPFGAEDLASRLREALGEVH